MRGAQMWLILVLFLPVASAEWCSSGQSDSRYEEALQRYRILALEDDGELLPVPAKPVEPGKSYTGVARLTRLLRELGDLPADAAAPAGVYAGALVEAVKHFQGRHGLLVDGRLGKLTLEQLNTPLSQRVRQLELNLERRRSLPRCFPAPPIIVNIPEFKVRAGDDLEKKVIAGQARGWHTPTLSAELTEVIFRPYWNVPARIQRRELVRDLERDRSYLAAHNFEVVTRSGNQVVTNRDVTPEILAQLRSGRLALRQVPGPENALGGVKFVFPNPDDVYMHDTPARSLFQRARRDLSHGCIRVEKAEDLAVWVLRDDPAWPRDRIREAMQGSGPLEVRLKQPIPVLVVYLTAAVTESGEVRFFEDIYGYDAPSVARSGDAARKSACAT